MREFRNDIQALRGLAVLLVLLYHARIGGVPAGFLGVDIFFVISGYLITQIIVDDIKKNRFTFSGFYFRRAKRLLPSAYLTILLTTLISFYFLTTAEFESFVFEVLGSVFYVANIVLWRQSDYFNTEAIFKPLLHMWSLAIEEQYYLLLPVSLVLIPRRFWALAACFVMVISLALCLVIAPWKPSAAFYLLPTRAWELAIGSVGVLILGQLKSSKALSWLLWPSVLLLFAIPAFPLDGLHPGANAAVVCVATLIVILVRSPLLNASPVVGGLAKIGDISYSLYLVHWPLFALAHNTYLSSAVPMPVRLGLVALSFLLGWALYAYIEKPIRQVNIAPSGRIIGGALVATAVLILLPIGIAVLPLPARDYAAVRRHNVGFDGACTFNSDFTPKPECRNAADPKIIVWGDSFAMHLVPGIAVTTDVGVIQATSNFCGPFVGLAPLDDRHQRAWAEECLRFNRSVLKFLAKTPSVEVVVISSAMSQYFGPYTRVLRAKAENAAETQAGISIALEALRETIAEVRSLGKRISLVAPPPNSRFNVGLCLERMQTGKITLGRYQGCQIATADYHQARPDVIEFVRQVARENDIDVIRFDDFLCSEQSCITSVGDTFIYNDGAHLSYDGSRFLAQRLSLGKRIMEASR